MGFHDNMKKLITVVLFIHKGQFPPNMCYGETQPSSGCDESLQGDFYDHFLIKI